MGKTHPDHGARVVSIGEFVYGPYGYDGFSVQSSWLGFNGEARDFLVGCYVLGRGLRVYNSVIMRFLSPDVLSPFDIGSLNAYSYCEGDPVNYTDPEGKSKFKPQSQTFSIMDPLRKSAGSLTIRERVIVGRSMKYVTADAAGGAASKQKAVSKIYWEENKQSSALADKLANMIVARYQAGMTTAGGGVSYESLRGGHRLQVSNGR